MQNPDQVDFQKSTRTSLSKNASVVKLSRTCDEFLQRYEPKCVKMLYLAIVLYSFIVQVDRTQLILGLHTSSFAYIVYL